MKIKENDIEWIVNNEYQEPSTLNNQPEKLLDSLGSVQNSNFSQYQSNFNNITVRKNNLRNSLEEENEIFSQYTLNNEVMDLIKQLQDINEELNTKQKQGTGLTETRNNIQNEKRYIVSNGGVVVSSPGNSSKNVMSQKQVTDHVTTQGQPAPNYTSGNGMVITGNHLNLNINSENLSIVNNKLSAKDTVYSSGPGITNNQQKTQFNVRTGTGISSNASSGLVLNSIPSSLIKNAPTTSKLGLGLTEEKWNLKATLNPQKSKSEGPWKYKNNKDYPIMVTISTVGDTWINDGAVSGTNTTISVIDDEKVTQNVFIFGEQKGSKDHYINHPASITAIVPPGASYEIKTSRNTKTLRIYVLE